MHRIDSSGSVAGEWSNGTPPLTPGTAMDATWFNAIQAELIAILTAAGISPVKATTTQIRDALYVLFGRLAVANTWTQAQTMTGDLTVDTDTLKVDSTNNRVGIGTAAPNARLSVGHAGVVDTNVPIQINAASAGEQYVGANKGGALALLIGYANGHGTFGTRGMIRNAQNEPISVYINGTSHIAEFNTNGIALNSANPTYPFTNMSNLLTPLNIPKAWGYVDAGNNTTTNFEGFNATCAITGGGDLAVTLPNPVAVAAGTHYCVQAQLYGTSLADRVRIGIVDNTSFTIRVVDSGGTLVDLTSAVVSRSISFTVFGRQ